MECMPSENELTAAVMRLCDGPVTTLDCTCKHARTMGTWSRSTATMTPKA